MFVQHKQLQILKVPASRVARLNTSSASVQLAFPGYPPQVAQAFLVALSGGSKVLILVGFYLTESKVSIFFVSQRGEVPVEEIEAVFDEGFVFAESMGFILNETDYHLLSSSDQQKLWASLPICRATESVDTAAPATERRTAAPGSELEAYRQRSLESLGRFLSSL